MTGTELRVYECPQCKCLVVHDGRPTEEIECTKCQAKRFVLATDKTLGEILTAMRMEIERQN